MAWIGREQTGSFGTIDGKKQTFVHGDCQQPSTRVSSSTAPSPTTDSGHPVANHRRSTVGVRCRFSTEVA